MDTILRKIVYRDLPPDVFAAINAHTSDQTVALMGYRSSDEHIDGLLASGSLVRVNSTYGVLTARHVWDMFEKKADKISFCVEKYVHYISERISHLRPFLPKDPDIDICFIGLPPTIIGTIKAKRTFFQIGPDVIPDMKFIRKLSWVSVGFPASIQSKQADRIIQIFRYYTHVKNYNLISSEWDQVELDVEHIDPETNLPMDFGGMSGGGIWNANIACRHPSEGNEFKIVKPGKDIILAGVNYYQKVESDHVTSILGLGPISIYKGLPILVG